MTDLTRQQLCASLGISESTVRRLELAGLTQADAAALILCGRRAWMEWEAGHRAMHPQLWECFRCKFTKSCLRQPPAASPP